MHIGTEILNKILVSWIKQYVKRIINHDQVKFILGNVGLLKLKSINVVHLINRLNKKKHMIIINERKAFDKIKHPFLILSKLGIENSFLKLKVSAKPLAILILNG